MSLIKMDTWNRHWAYPDGWLLAVSTFIVASLLLVMSSAVASVAYLAYVLLVLAPLMAPVASAITGCREHASHSLTALWLLLPAITLHEWYGFNDVTSFAYMAAYFTLMLPFHTVTVIGAVDALALSQVCILAWVAPIIWAIVFTTRSVPGDSYYASGTWVGMLALSTLLLSLCFLAYDLLGFYVLFESILMPMFGLLLLFGSGYRRVRAAYQLLLYTTVGSVSYIVATVGIMGCVGCTDVLSLSSAIISVEVQHTTWMLLMLTLLVKLPAMPLHVWLPQAHTEAPTVGSMLLAAVILKLAGYGILRFVVPMLPTGQAYFIPLLGSIALVSVLYGSLLTLRQLDLKRLIAYSSIAHMALVTLASALCVPSAYMGLVYLMCSHALVSAALFWVVGLLYDFGHTRLGKYLRGTMLGLPVWTGLLLACSLGNMGMPGTSSFIAELIVLSSSWAHNPVLGLIASLSLVLSTSYAFWLYGRAAHGSCTTLSMQLPVDVSWRDCCVGIPLLAGMLALGLAPEQLLYCLGTPMMALGLA